MWYDGKQPKYKIDWLLESLNMGRELEDNGNYVLDSIEANLPYFCETVSEYNFFFDNEKPVTRGSIEGILDLMLQYTSSTKLTHPSKLAYWQEQIKRMASNGNMQAQAALCAAKTNVYKGAFSETDLEEAFNKYHDSLIAAAERGDPQAQLAVGIFLTPYASRRKREMLAKATDADLTDAWYHLGHAFSTLIYSDEDGTWRGDTLPSDDKKALQEKEMECYVHGAEANNGIMAGWCQKYIAMWYEDGDGILPLDLRKAKYWYEKAAENGYDVRFSLENLNKRLNS